MLLTSECIDTVLQNPKPFGINTLYALKLRAIQTNMLKKI